MILVDEAYFHFADSPEYESVIPFVREHPKPDCFPHVLKNLRNGRIRCGYCVAQKETIERIAPKSNVGQCQLHGAGCRDCEPGRSRSCPKRPAFKQRSEDLYNVRAREDGLQNNSITGELHHVRLQETGRPLIRAMKERNVHVGRLFPALPNHMRLTLVRNLKWKLSWRRSEK